MVFHNGSNYDYHFIIKNPAKKTEGEFNCIGENTEKDKTFSAPIKKMLKGLVKMEYKLQEPYFTN